MLKILIGLAFITAPAYAAEVIGIADGDTLTVLQDRKPVRVRLSNIDAPEKRQSFGARSRQSLSELCYGKDAIVAIQSVDRYRRPVAVVTCGGVEANRAQIERGFAWVYTKYNTNKALPELEAAAKAERRGLWSDQDAMPPWEFRRTGRLLPVVSVGERE
ncbi:thermonuclease family protein [Massilia glaciei]|uniref:Thermonuclease family protein n=1 Tax=Massilia glaciei TaxID=1524097 RepID=A0A2U2HLJ9_9BURK|nr:thermonuclease family protein [Massilia glaciei]PWF48398.1 thermonuclease family protein [Massilia glaciei]